ncbi:pellino protein [Pararhizobium capsulatum DSM 1112]|uniref:Pellino protein n=1 Tax=Pararhizobium capsulatum DSM 1112 TaxID=1121113 RepID=A0ABU0BSA4_9HYPH|nr:hypothetical protein [Pararhizobium capsulatum]MDQ0321135.1 pellino protein [Pararhizobium capsulatum DSM 1112]
MMAKRTQSSRRKTGGKPMPGSLGEALDEIGFEPLFHRIVVGKGVVAKPIPLPDWVGPVAESLAQSLPNAPDGGWSHLSIGAFEVACQALIALGHAVEVTGGAKPVAQPKLPANLPRWDDIATAVVWLSSKSSVLGYRHFAGTRGGRNPVGLPGPNILAAHGSGPAYLEPRAFQVFQTLGLILDGRWTEQAETILWRVYPEQWRIDYTEDPRFVEACKAAVADVPKDIAAEIRKLASIPEQDIVEWLEVAERHAPTPKTRDDALRSLRSLSCMDIDRLFGKRWRLDGGWLSLEESKRTLYFQFDPVALDMRMKFASRYLPEFPFLSRWSMA